MWLQHSFEIENMNKLKKSLTEFNVGRKQILDLPHYPLQYDGAR